MVELAENPRTISNMAPNVGQFWIVEVSLKEIISQNGTLLLLVTKFITEMQEDASIVWFEDKLGGSVKMAAYELYLCKVHIWWVKGPHINRFELVRGTDYC